MATAFVRPRLSRHQDQTQMRRYVPLLIAGAALIAAACRDTIAPNDSAATSRPMVAMPSGAHVSSARVNRRAEDNASVLRFRLDPTGGMVRIGAFTVIYPRNAVCDPNRSGYGPDEWQKPCETLRKPIVMQAKFWVDEQGVAYADFSPDIRFDPSKKVWLVTYIPDVVGVTLTDAIRSQYSINYTVSIGQERFFVDDGAIDPALATAFGTQRNGTGNGYAWRRIYHFSGYYVRSGYACDSSDPACSDTGGQVY